MWTAIWVTLGVTTLAGAFLLGRDLWRTVRGLVRTVSRASSAAEAAFADRPAPTRPVQRVSVPRAAGGLFPDREASQRLLAELAAEREERRAARRRRLEEVRQSWPDVWR